MIKDLKSLLFLMSIYLKGKAHLIGIGFLISLSFSLISLATPYMTRFLIDNVFQDKRVDLLLPLLLLCVIIIAIMAFTGIVSEYLLIRIFEKAKMIMRYDLFQKLQKAPLNFILSQRSGELNFRLYSDTESIRGFFNVVIINVPIDILFSIILSIIMISWNAKIALFVFAVFLMQIIIILKFQKVLLKFAFKRKSKAQELSGFSVEKFRNIQLIRSLCVEETELKNFDNKLTDLMNIDVKAFIMNKISVLTVSLVNNIWSFGVLWLGGSLVLSEQLTLGTLMAFLLISGMLYPRVASLSNAVLSFQDVRASLKRFYEYYNVLPAVSDADDAIELQISKGDVVFDNVNFQYVPKFQILKGLSATFRSHTVTAIVGKSGAGKSTIARLLLRLYDPQSGNILIDGTDIKKVKINSLRKKTGYAIQGEYLFSGTIWDNICYGSDLSSENKVIAAAKKACAYEFIMGLPDKFNTRVGEGGFNISGGEAQRIALARLFLKKYKIVVLDEPTSFLDNETESDIQKAILSLKETATVIVIAHRLSTVKLADNILVMDYGRVVEEGTHEKLLYNGKIYSDLYHMLTPNEN